ncbi:MAG: sulfatase-like hydrolase/transferase [Chloroflexi bacterium]|nr:sulfatase-like hydrolase/transferase [Chloroflexota bacterium]
MRARTRTAVLMLLVLAVGTIGAAPAGAADGVASSDTASAAALTVAVPPSGGTGTLDASADRPDIIVVMLDDLGYLEDDRVLSRLPNIRQLWLRDGLRLRRMYDETPLCCPARATFLTGQHTLRHGVIRNDASLFDPRKTIAVALRKAGYHTVQVGKYLNGYKGGTPPGWDHASMVRGITTARFLRDGEFVRYDPVYVDEAIRMQAVDWVEEAPSDQPLFMWVATSAPHVCPKKDGLCYEPLVMARDRGASACAGVGRFKPPSYRTWPKPRPFPRQMPDWPTGWKLRSICESLLVVDRMVEDLAAAQAERGRPAWLILMSDNGMSWGQKGFPQKHVPTATRMPMYVKGPGVDAGATDALLSNIDIAPTLAAIGGTTLPKASGRSFLPLLRGQSFTARSAVLELQTRPSPTRPPYWTAVRTRDWHYIRWSTGRRELYRVRDDPWELRNLITRYPEKAAKLETRRKRLLKASK